MILQVYLTPQFKKLLKNYPKQDQLKINDFINHVKINGLECLKGLNKCSDNVPTDDPNWRAKVQQAHKYKLWHYHIGIPNYSLSPNGYYTSEYVLHYMLANEDITIVYMSPHPPFELPDEEFLISE